MTNKSYVLSIRFKNRIDEIESINFLRELCANYSDQSFEELTYTITDKSTDNWRQKTKTVKFSENNLLKFENVLNLTPKTGVDISFELLKSQKDVEFKSRDIDILISYHKYERINALDFIFNQKLFSKIQWKDFVKSVAHFLDKQKCEAVYGFLFLQDNSKLPAFYVEGIGTDELTDEEQRMLDIWSNNMQCCDSKIWDVFWGNLFSLSSHIDSDSVQKIIEIVGEENVVFLNHSMVWVSLSENIDAFDISLISSKRKRLYEYFKGKDLIMI